MTVTLTTRFGMTRWSSDNDPWSREELDANFGAIEDLAAQAVQGTNAARPGAGVPRRFYLATDAERVYVDDGDEWYEFLVLTTGGTVSGSVDLTGTNVTRNGVPVATTTNVDDVTTALGNHIADATAAHAASAISYGGAATLSSTDVEAALDELDTEKSPVGHVHAAGVITVTPTGNIASTDVQAALAELDTEKSGTGHTHAASAITNTPAGNVAATTVQAAIDELDAEKLAKAGGTVTGLVTFNSSPAFADGVDLTIGTGTGSKIGQAASKLGFFGATPVARPGTYNLTGSADRTLGAYASDPESAAYTGATDGEAKLTDLNALRTAYENLRVYVEDLAGVVIGTATDVKTLGLVG